MGNIKLVASILAVPVALGLMLVFREQLPYMDFFEFVFVAFLLFVIAFFVLSFVAFIIYVVGNVFGGKGYHC